MGNIKGINRSVLIAAFWLVSVFSVIPLCLAQDPGENTFSAAGLSGDDEIVIEPIEEHQVYPPVLTSSASVNIDENDNDGEEETGAGVLQENPPAMLNSAGVPATEIREPEYISEAMPSGRKRQGPHDEFVALTKPPKTTPPIGADYTKVMARLERMFKSNKKGIPSIFKNEDGTPIILPEITLKNAPARAFLLDRLNDSNVNVIIAPDIKCSISMRLKDVTLWTAVERVLDTCGLGWKINGRILQIDTLKHMKATTNMQGMVIKPYYLKYLKAEEVRKFLLGESTVQSTKIGLDGSGGLETPSMSMSGSGLIAANQQNNNNDGDQDYPSVVADEATNCVIIKDKPENVAMILKLLDAMDVPRPQIKIQTWIVETNRQTAKELGMRWSAMIRSGDTDFFTGSRDLFDGSQSQFRYPLEGIGRGVIPPQPNSDNSYEHEVNNRAYSGRPYSIGIAASGPNGAIVAELQALEQNGDLRILSRPELVLQDNREATITQGQDIYKSYVTLDQTGVNEINAKLAVTVKPHITPGGSLIIDVRLKDRWPNMELSSDRDTVINEKGIETRLFVANGQTVVLGGIRHAKQNNSSDGVPVLKDIPYVGNIFKYSSELNSLEELLLIMRPEIVRPQKGVM